MYLTFDMIMTEIYLLLGLGDYLRGRTKEAKMKKKNNNNKIVFTPYSQPFKCL